MSDSEGRPKIVVLGAGYGGLLATVRLAGKARRAEITLVNQLDVFIERVRLHQYAAGKTVRRRPIHDILRGTGVRFVTGVAERIDTARRRVRIQTEEGAVDLAYDYLVYALGSMIDVQGTPGAREHAYALNAAGTNSAEDLRAILPALNERGGAVAVVGGGATGIEAAAEFAEVFPNLRVSLITMGDLGVFRGGTVERHIRKRMAELSVMVRDNTTVVRVEKQAVVTAAGEAIPFDACLWLGGFAVPSLAREAGLAVNERGQVLIDPFMRSVSHPEVYALGDAAWPVEQPSVPVRMAAITAGVMGAHTADCLSNLLKGKAQRPLSFAYAAQAIALGRTDAVLFNIYPDDRPHRPILTGRTAVAIREFFVNFFAGLPNYERRWPGLLDMLWWLGKDRVRAAQVASALPAPVEEQPSS